jgi:pyruvate,water dikinase
MAITLTLNEAPPDDDVELGGKGANLAALVRAGLPVPPAFVVLADAFRRVVETNALGARVERYAAVVRSGDLADAKDASSAIESIFLSAPLPNEITHAICAAYATMGAGTVAVRSSATAEDLPSASFAGQHKTLLNVEGEEALLHGVRVCWASLWTPQAARYRARRGIADEEARMAVVVQRMAPANVSGVLFTRDPIGGTNDRLIINATWGLGEALVSGSVSPDVYVVRRSDRAVLRAELGAKQALAQALAGGGVAERAAPDTDRARRTLTDEQIGRLAQLGMSIERLFGRPQDVEWALASDFSILQARAITTQPRPTPMTVRQEELPAPGDDAWDCSAQPPQSQPYDLWTRANFGENFPEPITPLSMTAWPLLLYAGRWPSHEERQEMGASPSSPGRRFYGRLYVNEGAMLHISAELGIPRDFLDTVWGSGQGHRRPDDGRFHFGRMARRLPGLLHELAMQTPPRPRTRGVSARKAPRLSARRLDAQVDTWAAEFARQDLSTLPDGELWARWIPLLAARGKALTSTIAPTAILAAIWFYLLERRLRVWTGKAGQTATLTQALAGVTSAEVGPALWELAQALRASRPDAAARAGTSSEALATQNGRPEGAAFRMLFAAFLDRHGFRCPNDSELRNPRWADAPEQALELVRTYLDVDASHSPLAVAARARDEREALTRTIEARLNPFRLLLFRFLLTRTQRGVRTRDNHRSSATRFMYPVRQIFAELGRRWAARGWLAAADDIFFLTAFEIEDLALSGDPNTLRQVALARRAAFDYWARVTPPVAIGPDGTPTPELEPQGASLEGTGASGGRARGRARLIHSVAEAERLEPGDIMVAAATDPGWTAIFPLASGLVIEVGGQLSHAAIVAREYGIPAVINVPGAMQAIRDGQLIEVDGAAGQVTLLSGGEANE